MGLGLVSVLDFVLQLVWEPLEFIFTGGLHGGD